MAAWTDPTWAQNCSFRWQAGQHSVWCCTHLQGAVLPSSCRPLSYFTPCPSVCQAVPASSCSLLPSWASLTESLPLCSAAPRRRMPASKGSALAKANCGAAVCLRGVRGKESRLAANELHKQRGGWGPAREVRPPPMACYRRRQQAGSRHAPASRRVACGRMGCMPARWPRLSRGGEP